MELSRGSELSSLWSLASNVSKKKKEDVVEVEESEVEEVPALVEYEEDELNLLVLKVKKMVRLFDLREEDWNNDVFETIRDFFRSSVHQLLCIFLDEGTLRASLGPPLVPVHDLTYYAKYADPKRPVVAQHFFKSIQFGTLSGNIEGNILKIMQYVFAPQLFLGNRLAGSVKCDLLNDTHTFLANLTDLHHKMSGLTVLYIPLEGMGMSAKEASNDKELARRLEAVCVKWNTQIRVALNDEDEATQSQRRGPVDEYEFWVYRCDNLAGLQAQMENSQLQHVASILNAVSSAYIRTFQSLAGDLQTALDLATSNAEFLQLLTAPCAKLAMERSPETFPGHVSKILQALRVIWMHSDFYRNSKSRMAALCHDLGSQVILQCRRFVDLPAMFSGRSRQGEAALRKCIDCCHAYKIAYLSSVAAFEEMPGGSWEVDTLVVFTHIDSFIQRCEDMIEVCTAMALFARMDEMEEIPRPRFSGTRGPEFELICYNIEVYFKETLAHVEQVIDAILNVDVASWYHDMKRFRHDVKNIVGMIEKLVQEVFGQACDPCDAIDSLQAMYYYAKYTTLKPIFEKKTVDVYMWIIAEIQDTLRDLQAYPEYRHNFTPRYAGRVLHAEAKLRWVTMQVKRMTEAQWMSNREYRSRVMEHYTNLAKLVDQTRISMLAEWRTAIDMATKNEKLNRPLMMHSHARRGYIEVNVDRGLFQLLDETKFWEKMKVDLPTIGKQLWPLNTRLRRLYMRSLTVVQDYNRLISELSDEERLFFAKLVEVVDKKIEPGMNKLRWDTESADDYILDCAISTKDLQDFVIEYKEACKVYIEACEKICDMKLIEIAIGEPYELHQLDILMRLHMSESLVELLDHYQNLQRCLCAVREGFGTSLAQMMPQWRRFLIRLDDVLEESLRICAKRSMQQMLDYLRGPSVAGPVPFIKIKIHLNRNEINCKPSMIDVDKFVTNTMPSIVESAKVFPRVFERFKLTFSDRPPFHKVIELDFLCNELQQLCDNEMDVVMEEMTTYVRVWDPFREIWETNKDMVISRYEKAAPGVETFEDDIAHYADVAIDVQQLDSNVEIRFLVVNCDKLKTSVMRHCSDWQQRLLALLQKLTRQRIVEQYQYTTLNTERLQVDPEDLAQLAGSMNLFDELRAEVAGREADLPLAKDMLRVLIDNMKTLEPELLEKLAGMNENWLEYLLVLDEAEKAIMKNKEKFRTGLIGAARVLEGNAAEAWNKYQLEGPFTSAWAPIDALNYLVDLRGQLVEFHKQEAQLAEELKLFNVTLPVNQDLLRLERDLDALEVVWELAYQWEQAWASYKTGGFWVIETEEMEITAQTLFRKLTRLSRELKEKNWEIVGHTRQLVDAFRRTLPLIADLKNTALRDRHWERVKKAMNSYFDHNSPDFTLEAIIAMNMQEWAEDISEISNAATMELSIENGIKAIGLAWKDINLDMVQHKDKPLYRLKGVDDIFQVLEEHQMALSAMKSTRFVEPFARVVDMWERTLSLVMEVLEMFLTVQRQWLYLENIFGGEDIRKQLPMETEIFDELTSYWCETTVRMHGARNALKATQSPNMFKTLNAMNDKLEAIQRALEKYLETKRHIFPRFYFISNDDLLEILAQARRPDLVQPHLKKCFDNINKLRMNKVPGCKPRGAAIVSADGESIDLKNDVELDGPVELWLCAVEDSMRVTLRDQLKQTRATLKKNLGNRDRWIKDWPGQTCITASQIQWTTDCQRTLMLCKMFGKRNPMKKLRKKMNVILNKFSEAICGQLSKIQRLKVVALVTIEIHARDVIDKMYRVSCTDVNAFEWLSQLRFYWDRDIDDCLARQTNTCFRYAYEYLGNSGRLVITPLTDRCYITLTTALHLYRGGSPKGPAGTGKTETVKDLGKGLGMYVIVVNCSEGLDYRSMGRMFSGLAQTGAWGCFDEFNRINIEVLSVVAQQILSILSALAAKLKRFVFESAEIALVSTCGVFITMNPGYAGRTELPDNLKSMFRPISMIVPDSAMISEIILFGEGFKNTRALAKKVYTLYQLAMQQLSKQDHYDFGLRGMVALLRYAGRKRRAHAHLPNEEVILLAMKDMNVAKLTADDLPLFNGITNDLFPGIEAPKIEYEDLGGAIVEEFHALGLQPIPASVTKVIQLYETKNSRHSVVIVGRTGSGKSTTWKGLRNALTHLRKLEVAGYNVVREYPINPKALSLGELYGEFNLSTNEWLDGVLSAIMRKVCAEETPDEKWILFDGPVDAVWIENMNSVMDDNKVLTLINSERIVMPEQVSLLFEVEDLAVASPATVSRCGVVYTDHKDLGWRPYADSWLQRQTNSLYVEEMERLFARLINPVLEFKRHHCAETVPVNELNAVMSLCKLLDCLATKANGVDEHLEDDAYLTMVKLWFTFCVVWSLCASVDEDGRRKMDLFIREMEGGFPLKDTIYEYFVDPRQRQMSLWENKLEDRWVMDKSQPFFKTIVPTVDTVRYQFLVGTLLKHGHPGLLVGPVGTGKTSTSATVLEALDPLKFCVLMINMSAQTSSNNVQDMIESRVEKRTKGVYVPAGNKTMVTFMDDLNMPAKETYGSQPPLELIRQWIDYGFWYDRQKQEVKHVKEMLLMAAMGPPGGGRNVITNRLLSRFNVINMTFPSNTQVLRIFGSMLEQQFVDFPEEVKILAEPITKASIDLYSEVVSKMLPTPSKTHYLFNLRDISKIFQGLLRSHRDFQDSKGNVLRLWIHECFRVFSDRLVDDKDLDWFVSAINETLGKHFDLTFHNLCPSKESPIFGDFINPYNVYEDLNNLTTLRKYIEVQMDEYNVSPGVVRMDLVLFKEAIAHICHVVRVISQPRGNMMLVGIGGSGRQSLSRIAAYICEYNTFQIEVTKNYRVQEFREDLKSLYRQTGVEARATTFLFNDTQIADETFLEIINNMLSSGEVPNLYKPDEFEEIKGALQKAADREKIAQTSEAMFSFLINRVRANLHIVLCMSPIGDSFRNRLRQYPSFVNCTTIDWLHEWPEEALLEVANKYLVGVNFLETITVVADKDKLRDAQMAIEQERLRLAVAGIFATIHGSVSRMSRVMMLEMKRPNYVTPTNYLELVAGYKIVLDDKRLVTASAANKLRNGLFKIDDTREKVGLMALELEVAKKQVMEVQVQCEEYMVIIMKQKLEADEQQISVAARSIKIMEEEVACKKLADAAQADLNEAMPALEEAMRALDALNKKDLTEIRSYGRPPAKVEMVMEAVMIMKKVEPTWAEAKRQLGEQNFLKDLRDFDKDNVSERTMKKIATYTRNPEFEPEKVGIVSFAAKSLCLWVRAIEKYAKLYRIVAPKRQRLDEAMSVLLLKQKSLADAKARLEELAAMLEKLKLEYDEKLEQKEELRKKAELLEQKLERAAQLVDGLAGEKVRWEQTVHDLDAAFDFLPGDCLIATGFVSYLGPFVTHYRDDLVKHWTSSIKELEVPISQHLNIMEFLSDPTTIREWNIQGLPSDDFSTENGIIVTRAMRWPLLIDPQCQGMKWIKSMEAPRDLKVIDFGQLDFMRTLETAIQLGQSVLLQNVMEVLDPSLEPILNKAFVKQGGQVLLKINDKMVSYNEDFRFFITTKLSNPHYPPEISTKTTLVNFAVKEQGLQAQLLGIVVRKEKPILEEQKDSLVLNIATGKRTLKELEDNLLRLLNEAKGSLLDDLDLLITLQTSKATSTSVAVQLEVAEVTEVEIDTAREGYRACAERATILFFVLNDMSRIDPMYQFSLDAYIGLFTISIERSKKTEVLDDRITFLNEYHTYSVYRNTCRGLFESHKLLFSFHMCIKILQALNKISPGEYDFLLKGGVVLDRENQVENPCPTWMTDVSWDNITELDKVSGFHGVISTFETYPRDWMNWYTQKTPEIEPLIGEWDGICSEFQRMLFVRSLRPDRITACVTTFIINTLGPQFVEPPVLDIRVVLEDSSCHTPLIFVLSAGVDPTTALIQLADHQGMSENFHSLSLGQGQAPIATKLIQQGARDGDWVFLANCHLSLSWMPKLDKIVEMLQTAKVAPTFRLWLSSSPHPEFPISILQAGIKMTTEPPKGIKANLKRLYQLMSETRFEMCQNFVPYRRLLFSLCFFHSVLLERKKFQKLGWNVIYSFNDSDFEVSENLLSLYLDEYQEVPWDALKYLIADVNYGGHVTDDWDRRLLTTYINLYFNDKVIDIVGYRLSSLPTYCIPRDGQLSSYSDFISTLPNVDQPEAFGQHSNADITSLITVTRSLFETLMSLQVQVSDSGGETKEEKVQKMAADILSKIPMPIDYEQTEKLMGELKTPLDVVLLQEIARYNVLLVRIRSSLEDLQRGILGLVVMSVYLEDIFTCIFEGRVPQFWLKAYPSLKLLGSWARDLLQRVEHFTTWAETTHPPIYFWLSAYTFPTGFLTAVLQTSARSANISIDSLSWDFVVFTPDERQRATAPVDGGVFVRGLFLEGAGWDRKLNCLVEPQPMQLVTPMPIVHFKPVEQHKKRKSGVYACPAYYYPVRCGDTGRPAFVVAVDLRSGDENADHWIKRATALLLSLAN